MSSGLKIRIPARRSTLANSGEEPPSIQPSSSVKKSKSQSEMNVEVEIKTEYLPERKFTARSGNKRNPPERWVQWETDFLEKCWEATRYPDHSLRSKWSMILTEKRLRNIKPGPEDKENLAEVWLGHYKRRLGNWFKNRKAKLRREGEVLVEENPEDLEDDEESPVALPRIRKARNHSVTVVHRYTVTKKHRYREEDDEEEFRDDSPESEEGQSKSDKAEDDTPEQTNPHDDEVLKNGSRPDMLAHLPSLEQPLPISACRDEPMSERRPQVSLTFPTSTSQSELLAQYDDDVIFGATLLMQLKMGHNA